MKRRTLLGLGILALALGLTACNGGKEKSPQGDSKQEADSGKGNEKANAKPNEDYFEWMGEDSIANLNEEGAKQKVIVIPKRAKSFDSGLGPDDDVQLEELYFESDDDFQLGYGLTLLKKVKKIVLPKNQTSEVDVQSDHNLESLDIPAGVTSIARFGFRDCTSLKEVNFLGEQLKVIPDSAFLNCSALEKISIPNSVESIEEAAFQNCKSLKEVHMPKNLKEIGSGAFAADPVDSYYFPKEIENLKVLPDSFASTGKSNFYVVKDSWLDKNFEEVFGILGEKQYYDGE